MEVTNIKVKIVRNEKGYLELLKVSEVFEVTRNVEKTGNESTNGARKKLIQADLIGKIPLKLVSPMELKKYRKSNNPGFVLKDNETYYYSEIREFDVDVDTIVGEHKCSAGKYCCKHLSAATDENGGCAKVRELSTMIEKYDFITLGYETFNTVHDVFVVLECSHYNDSK